jgi:hypothetical protein
VKPYSRLGLILSITYIGIFALSEFIAFYSLIFDTANSALSSVLAVFVTLPWSMILVSICSQLGYIAWYSQFASTPALYGFFAMLGILPGALLNAVIVYQLGKARGCKWSHGSSA